MSIAKNNTSSAFELPSEFKVKWENLVKDSMLDAFGAFFDHINIIVPIMQYTIRCTQ